LYDFRADAVNIFDSFFFAVFPGLSDPNCPKTARLLITAEYSRRPPEY